MATGGDGDLISACLWLRMTIEALAYGVVKIYREDLTDEELSLWQPPKVLAMLNEVDPGADGDMKLIIESDEGPIELAEHRLKAKWVEKAYHTLGSYLHERQLMQLERGRDLNRGRIRRKAERIAVELRKVLASPGFDLMLRFHFDVPCCCGRPVNVGMGPRQLRGWARCETCAARIELRRAAPDSPKVAWRVFPKRSKPPPAPVK